MSRSDHDLVNFGEDHELDYVLRKYGHSQSAANREKLTELGKRAKTELNVRVLTHAQLYQYIEKFGLA